MTVRNGLPSDHHASWSYQDHVRNQKVIKTLPFLQFIFPVLRFLFPCIFLLLISRARRMNIFQDFIWAAAPYCQLHHSSLHLAHGGWAGGLPCSVLTVCECTTEPANTFTASKLDPLVSQGYWRVEYCPASEESKVLCCEIKPKELSFETENIHIST